MSANAMQDSQSVVKARSGLHPDTDELEPVVSLVIAVFNEVENIPRVMAELAARLATMPSHEIIAVDDGSTDATAAALDAAREGLPELRVLRHDRRCGKTAALRSGVLAARGRWIVTMDGDGQNDPADIPAMVALCLAATGPLLVAGVRPRRHDPWSRRAATRVANGFRQAVLADGCPDSGCGLKAFPRDLFLRLPAFEGMHRFLPALFQTYGASLVCHEVAHRPRLAGRSKYTNWKRALVGLADLAGVLWLRARTTVPGGIWEDHDRAH